MGASDTPRPGKYGHNRPWYNLFLFEFIGWIYFFTAFKLSNFEIRVGLSDEPADNGICHKQFDVMEPLVQNITCSRELYGNWVSINKTHSGDGVASIVLMEVRVYGSKSK